MKSDNVKKQIEAAQAKQSQLATPREVLQKRVTFLTLQAEALEYPAQSDKQAEAQRGGLLGELSDLAQKIRANEQEAEAVSANIAALQAEYQAARLEEETVSRDRAALQLIECRQEIESHQAAIRALNDRVPALKAEADRLNDIVANMGGRRLEYSTPPGSNELKAGFFRDMRATLQSALS